MTLSCASLKCPSSILEIVVEDAYRAKEEFSKKYGMMMLIGTTQMRFELLTIAMDFSIKNSCPSALTSLTYFSSFSSLIFFSRVCLLLFCVFTFVVASNIQRSNIMVRNLPVSSSIYLVQVLYGTEKVQPTDRRHGGNEILDFSVSIE